MCRPLKRTLISVFNNSELSSRRALNTMAGIQEITQDSVKLASLPYTHCNTQIVSLKDLDIPDQATESECRDLYEKYTQQSSPRARNSNASLLRDAIESIKHGIAPPVGFPTETVYGLGADATNKAAVGGIFAAKGRPSDNPLIVHVASVEHLERLTGSNLPEVYRPVVQKYWPGPLTILLPVPENNIIAKNVHPAQSTIGFRIPCSKYARFFIAATDRPIAGPSANSSGKPSPTTARHVLHDLKGKINFVLDGGACDVGVESTVVDGLHDPPLVLRPGGVSLEEFRAIGRQIGGDVGHKWARTAIGYKQYSSHSQSEPQMNGIVNGMSESSVTGYISQDGHSTPEAFFEDANGAPRAPGMKYRHYAPTGRLILFSNEALQAGRVEQKLREIVDETQSLFKDGELRIGIISCYWPPFAGTEHFSQTHSETQCPMSTSSSLTASPYQVNSSARTLALNGVKVTVYNVHLGPDLQALAHSLFGVLRLFDDLGCQYIFAEEVQRMRPDALATTNGHQEGAEHGSSYGKSRHDLEDAIIDRISKAAAEHIS
jgi:L-threonylcarbamoyladenylate synthase